MATEIFKGAAFEEQIFSDILSHRSNMILPATHAISVPQRIQGKNQMNLWRHVWRINGAKRGKGGGPGAEEQEREGLNVEKRLSG